MHRFLFVILLLVSAGLSGPVRGAQQPTDGLPPRPSPFRFVTDQAQLLSPADAKTLEGGLRRYADSTGTQIVVVTVPTLGGRAVADYGRALGEAWGVGQRGKNNGIVLLLSGQERQVTIQAGSGLRAQITPELTNRVISQEMAPSFKQGRYFAGLRTGLNSLMLAANPNYAPQGKQQAATTPGPATLGGAAGSASTDGSSLNNELPAASEPASEPYRPAEASPEPSSPGMGIGTMAIGALVIGGILWLVMRMFRRKAPDAPRTVYSNQNPNQNPNQTPDFLGNQSARSAGNYTRGHARQPVPDFLGTGTMNRGGGGLSSGMGGILATGAAAAAGAYLGNRMASGGHSDQAGNSIAGGDNTAPQNLDPANTYAAGVGGAATSGGFPALEGTGNVEETSPDYFSDLPANSSEPDFFSADETSSYDDTASDDTGGGDFDDTNNNSGSW
ncbi:TPM domain-containing protein [Hymenobacter qilianensis]|uniref:TPM domain-containing protein n=1 Tax=Hymenobacter qilianensis TaxID=1385715 RepID=A0A7H0GY61_9BACT|nr:TPM domain-containing protein [Hymenobacter qilianensis]QNP53227.1 TPM domain-containing protein [Hymenobacter qilianensis]